MDVSEFISQGPGRKTEFIPGGSNRKTLIKASTEQQAGLREQIRNIEVPGDMHRGSHYLPKAKGQREEGNLGA